MRIEKRFDEFQVRVEEHSAEDPDWRTQGGGGVMIRRRTRTEVMHTVRINRDQFLKMLSNHIDRLPAFHAIHTTFDAGSYDGAEEYDGDAVVVVTWTTTSEVEDEEP